MTISSTNTKNSYSGDGSTVAFSYTFKILDDDDITVILRTNATGTETVQTKTTHYSVSGVGNAGGGTITFVSAPATTVTVVLLRNVPLTQTTDYTPNDPFPAVTHEDALDKLTLMAQDTQEEVDRSIKLSRTNTMTSTEFTVGATDRANKVFAFDSSGELAVTQEIGTFQGNWAASTAYAERDLVKDTSTNNIFIVNSAHTSSGSQPLTTNANASKYDLIVDAAAATTSATNAATSATAAATSATAAANSASAAATSESNAAASESSVSDDATAAAASAASASTSATNASTSETNASNSASAASTSATNAATSATSASNSASAAGTSESNAATSATNASNSASAAATSASNASTSESNASTSETNAATSASSAASDASAAATSAASAAASFDAFDDIYLGAKASAPTVDNDGDALTNGDLYFDTGDNELYIWNGSAWQAASPNIVADTTPQLGGDLDTNGNDINFGDNDKAIFGAGSDLQIYHDGSNSFIVDNGTGLLAIRGSTAVALQGTNGENAVIASENGAVDLRYDNSTKLATTSTGVDVTGTVTADGLTVDTTTLVVDSTNNRVGIGTSSPEGLISLPATASNTPKFRLQSASTNTDFAISSYADANGTYVSLGANHYLDSGGNDAVFETTDRSAYVLLDARNNGVVAFGTNSSGVAAERMRIQSDGSVQFKPDGTTVDMTLDASGNLLVGRTSVGGTGNGHSIRGGDSAIFSRDAVGETVQIGRNSSAGQLVRFNSNGTQVGSIGVNTDRLFIGDSSFGGIAFPSGGSGVLPAGGSGALNDNTHDLGNSSARFKDLYLSGGAYLGGTGSANLLSDYEEGSINDFSVNQGTCSTDYAIYTKIGRFVTVQVKFSTFTNRTNTNAVVFTGLPFSSSTSGIDSVGTVLARYVNTGDGILTAMVFGNSNQIYVYGMTDGGNNELVDHNHLTDSSAQFYITITYETNS
jgi:hypothetical protein